QRAELVGGRQDSVGRAALEVDAAVAVTVDAQAQVVARQHLQLADFAGPGACDVGRNGALIDKAKQCDELRPEKLRSAAVESKRGQRIERREISLDGTEV